MMVERLWRMVAGALVAADARPGIDVNPNVCWFAPFVDSTCSSLCLHGGVHGGDSAQGRRRD